MIVIPISTGVGFDSSSPLPPPPAPCPMPRPAPSGVVLSPLSARPYSTQYTHSYHRSIYTQFRYPFRSVRVHSTQVKQANPVARLALVAVKSQSFHPSIHSVSSVRLAPHTESHVSRRLPSRIARALRLRSTIQYMPSVNVKCSAHARFHSPYE